MKAALASGDGEHKAEAKKKAVPRKAAGQSWEDPTLADWPENDHRLFCGDLGNEVNDEVLTKAFARFSSFNMARVSSWHPFFSVFRTDSVPSSALLESGCPFYPLLLKG